MDSIPITKSHNQLAIECDDSCTRLGGRPIVRGMSVAAVTEPERDPSVGWDGAGYSSGSCPIFIGGSPRSGTTLLSVMLNAHPSLVCGPESDLLRRWQDVGAMPRATIRWWWHRLRGWTQPYQHLTGPFDMPLDAVRGLRLASSNGPEFIDRFFDAYAGNHGATRWVEKSPANVTRLGFLFEHFPQAKFVHLIRDGRDVACSLRKWSVQISRHEASGIEECIKLWDRWVREGLAWRGHPNYVEIRYEDLVRYPEQTLRPLFDWLDLTWDDRVLSYASVEHDNRPELAEAHVAGTRRSPYTNSIGRWQASLNRSDRRIVHETAGALLGELDYIDGDAWVDV